jgi:hypothetical protein
MKGPHDKHYRDLKNNIQSKGKREITMSDSAVLEIFSDYV